MLKVGVVIPNYNDSKYLIHTLDSVFKQTSEFDEVIFVDDFSTDNSVQIVKNYPKKIKIYKNKQRSGCFSCLNKGLGRSTSDYLLFLSSNDYIEENLVDELRKSLKNKKIGLWSALTNVQIGTNKKPFISPSPALNPLKIKSNQIAKKLKINDIWFTGSTTFYNVALLKKLEVLMKIFWGFLI